MDWKNVDDMNIGLFVQALTILQDCLLERIEKDKAEGKIDLDPEKGTPKRLSEDCRTFAHLSPEMVLTTWARVWELSNEGSNEILRRMKAVGGDQ